MSANANSNANSRPAKRTRRKERDDLDASFLARFLSRPTSVSALTLLTSKKSNSGAQSQRRLRRLAALAGIESSWCECDQGIPENVSDLAGMIAKELHEPYRFYRNSLFGEGDGDVDRDNGGAAKDEKNPRSMFSRRMATPPMRLRSGNFWTAKNGVVPCPWLPPVEPESSRRPATFDAVVHFVQASSGTGVHVGNGRILTCAHVVEAGDDNNDDDDDDPSSVPDRIGRKKIVAFPSGRTFIAECRAGRETPDGREDVALLVLTAEIELGAPRAAGSATARSPLPAASVADEAASRGSRLFCVGNPSRVDLEGHEEEEELNLDPPAWHASVGACKGYLDPSVHEAMAAQDARGRPPTRGEAKFVREAEPVDADAGAFLLHSCWTYWGHSGAPLFDQHGKVVGLHCAWDDKTGMRHGQKLQHIHKIMRCLTSKEDATQNQDDWQ